MTFDNYSLSRSSFFSIFTYDVHVDENAGEGVGVGGATTGLKATLVSRKV